MKKRNVGPDSYDCKRIEKKKGERNGGRKEKKVKKKKRNSKRLIKSGMGG